MNTTQGTRMIAAGVLAGLVATLLGPVSATEASERQAAAKRFKVTAKVSDSEPEQGDTIRIRGEVKPSRPGTNVRLQVRYGKTGKWTNKARTKITQKGKYRFKDELTTVQFRQYRVVKARGDRAKGVSAKMPVTVYGWRNLISLDPVSQDQTYEVTRVTMNAVKYPRSITGSPYGNSGSIAYNLNRRCTAIRGLIGLADNSATEATATVGIAADGDEVYSNTFGLTQSQQVAEDLTGAFRIDVTWTSFNPDATPPDTSGAVIGFGAPQVLCSF